MAANATLKKQRALTEEVHTLLYENIQLLKHLYPSTKELDVFCKPDMFVKNNKAAFQQVMHYLLKIYNPQLKQVVPSWPILSTKMEIEFRKEVIAYLNQLKDKHPECGLKTMVASQLVNPGGFRFAQFMLGISELVLLQVLKGRSMHFPPCLLPPKYNIKHPEQVKIFTDHLRKLTEEIELNNYRKLKEHYGKSDAHEQEAEEIAQEVLATKLNITKLKQELVQLQEDAYLPCSLDDIQEVAADVEENFGICKKLNQSSSILQYYTSDKCYIENPTVEHEENLSFIKHFKKLEKFSAAKIFDVRYINPELIDQNLDILKNSLHHCDGLLQKCADLQNMQELFISKLNCDSAEQKNEK